MPVHIKGITWRKVTICPAAEQVVDDKEDAQCGKPDVKNTITKSLAQYVPWAKFRLSFNLCEPGGSWNRLRTDCSGVWNQMAPNTWYSPINSSDKKWSNSFKMKTQLLTIIAVHLNRVVSGVVAIRLAIRNEVDHKEASSSCHLQTTNQIINHPWDLETRHQKWDIWISE